jgi:DNA segregation ATPase FtsK/SpoIIIE-like protein
MPSKRTGPFGRPDLIKPLAFLPHVLFPVVANTEESFEILQFLTDEVTYREEMGVEWPLLVVFIDNADRLLASGDYGITSLITRLTQVSPAAGFRLVLSATNPDSGELGRILKHNVSLHLTGRTNLPPVYGRIPASNHLSGQGDFLARSYGAPRRFQAAFMDDYDLQLALSDLTGQDDKVLLARPSDLGMPG